MKILTLDQIREVLPLIELVPEMEQGFVAYSRGEVVVPPVGELILPRGEVHIKSGYVREGDFYVVKIASGFYENPKLGLPSGDGLMLLFSQKTGELRAALFDRGYLTDLRTAAAGAVAAKHLANPAIGRIGVLGTGVQARLQLSLLKGVTSCRKVLVWGRGEAQMSRYVRDMATEGFDVQTTTSPNDLLESCDLIVTTTPSREPLLFADSLRPGVHITAIGSDTPEKQELDGRILHEADVVVADSLSQCRLRGEIHRAMLEGNLEMDRVRELGRIVSCDLPGRTAIDQITVADLTGVAVQDLKIAEAVYRRLA